MVDAQVFLLLAYPLSPLPHRGRGQGEGAVVPAFLPAVGRYCRRGFSLSRDTVTFFLRIFELTLCALLYASFYPLGR